MKNEEILPERIQRTRAKGFKMPENTIYVGRPGKWGNPFKVGEIFTRGAALMHFENIFKSDESIFDIGYPSISEIKKELKGKNLACWCPVGIPCHADILLKIANS